MTTPPPIGDVIISLRLRPVDRIAVERLAAYYKLVGRGTTANVIRRALAEALNAQATLVKDLEKGE